MRVCEIRVGEVILYPPDNVYNIHIDIPCFFLCDSAICFRIALQDLHDIVQSSAVHLYSTKYKQL